MHVYQKKSDVIERQQIRYKENNKQTNYFEYWKTETIRLFSCCHYNNKLLMDLMQSKMEPTKKTEHRAPNMAGVKNSLYNIPIFFFQSKRIEMKEKQSK